MLKIVLLIGITIVAHDVWKIFIEQYGTNDMNYKPKHKKKTRLEKVASSLFSEKK